MTNNSEQCRQLLKGEKLNNSTYLVDFILILIRYSKSLKRTLTQTYHCRELINDSQSRFVDNFLK